MIGDIYGYLQFSRSTMEHDYTTIIMGNHSILGMNHEKIIPSHSISPWTRLKGFLQVPGAESGAQVLCRLSPDDDGDALVILLTEVAFWYLS